MELQKMVEERVKREWPAVDRALSPPPASGGVPPSFDQFVSWSPRISPGFPAAWPPGARADLDFYAYAGGLQLAVLRDAERTTAPWARLRTDLLHGTVEVELLTGKPEEIGIQGVRPLTGEEVRIFAGGAALHEEFAEALKQGKRGWFGGYVPASLAARLKEYYRLWGKTNGVAARAIRPQHGSFFEWVEAR